MTIDCVRFLIRGFPLYTYSMTVKHLVDYLFRKKKEKSREEKRFERLCSDSKVFELIFRLFAIGP